MHFIKHVCRELVDAVTPFTFRDRTTDIEVLPRRFIPSRDVDSFRKDFMSKPIYIGSHVYYCTYFDNTLNVDWRRYGNPNIRGRGFGLRFAPQAFLMIGQLPYCPHCSSSLFNGDKVCSTCRHKLTMRRTNEGGFYVEC